MRLEPLPDRLPEHPMSETPRDSLLSSIGLLESAGFGARRATYANSLLFWAAVPHRFLSRLKGSGESDVKPASPLMNRLFGGALGLESKMVRRVAFPFGLSVIVVARKPD